MKNFFLAACLFMACYSTLQAQNDSIYFWKTGALIIKQSMKPVDLDSLTFESPKNNKDSIYLWKSRALVIKQSIKSDDLDSITFKAPRANLQRVNIGAQVWSSNNLNVVTYRDGTPIPQVTDPIEWAKLTTGAWCYYINSTANGTTYGLLYNWYAVAGIHDTDPKTPNKILAPTGWRVPTHAEWDILTNFLGGVRVAGGKMKTTGTTLWKAPNVDASNSSGFGGLPGGYRNLNGEFVNIGTFGNWWSSTESSSTSAWYRDLNNDVGDVSRLNFHKRFGFSVRLVRE